MLIQWSLMEHIWSPYGKHTKTCGNHGFLRSAIYIHGGFPPLCWFTGVL